MRAFSELLDRLVLTPSRNGKLKLLTDYFRVVPDPDRGWGLAAITGDVDIRNVKPAMLRALVAERVDPFAVGTHQRCVDPVKRGSRHRAERPDGP